MSVGAKKMWTRNVLKICFKILSYWADNHTHMAYVTKCKDVIYHLD